MARTGFLILVAVFVLLASSLASSPAYAQSKNCRIEQERCSVAEAQAQCDAFQPNISSNSSITTLSRKQCGRDGGPNDGRFYVLYWGRDSRGVEQGPFNPAAYFWWVNKCSSESGYTGTGPWSSSGGSAVSGSLGCRNGCDGIWQKNADSSYTWSALGNVCPDDQKKNCQSPSNMAAGYYWNPILRVCEPPEIKCQGGAKPNSLGQCAPEPCPEGKTLQQDGTCKTKENECPAGQIRSPDGKCLPGDGQCAAGEVRGPDGTCKKDSDGDGDPDEPGEKETFSGGDDCAIPPSCSGSPILCGQARIQWRIDCNTRKNRNIAGGTCAAMPVCTGEKCDAMEYSSLLMQWRTACATEKLLTKDSGNGGDGSQPEWTKVTGMSTDPGAGSSPSDTDVLTTKKIGISDLDQSGIGGSGSCVGFVTGGGGASGLSSGFMQVMASPPAFFCNFISQIRATIILLASVACVYILSRGAP